MTTDKDTLQTLSTFSIHQRFRGFLPVVVDVETGGFNPETDALLEIAISIISADKNGQIIPGEIESYHIEPFEGAKLDPAALEFNKIKPYHPFRFAVSELTAFTQLFESITKSLKQTGCHRAVLVGHNPAFDLSFLQAAVKRCQIKKNPFHSFTTFDTATLGALAFGQTVLAKALKGANIEFDPEEAHSAAYDAAKTAQLFCTICNEWQELGGWPRPKKLT